MNGIPAMLSSQAPLYLPEDLKAEISHKGRDVSDLLRTCARLAGGRLHQCMGQEGGSLRQMPLMMQGSWVPAAAMG